MDADIVYFHRNIRAGFSINKVTKSYTSLIHNKVEHYVPSYRALPFSILNNLWFVRRHRKKYQINHITGDIHYCMISLIGCKSVLTVHDTNSVTYGSKSHFYKWFRRIFWFTIPLKIATKVTCISNETKRHLEQITKRKDIEVIMNPISPGFKPYIKEIISNPPNVLLVGTNYKKNVIRTIRALEGINCILTIIGTIDERIVSELSNCHIKYVNKTNLSDEEIISEYINCDVVSFASLFEGFGMPIIEAQAIGRVVVTSNIPPMNEVANSKNAILVNPYSVESIREGLIRAISDDNLRNSLIKEGLNNVQKFKPENIAKLYQALYDSIL